MDRVALVHAARRRQAVDALVFEREREAMLAGELEDVVAGIDGERVDADLFAQMSPEEVLLVRALLGLDSPALDDAYGEASVEPDADAREQADELEEEVVRLGDELASSRGRQAALQRYLDLLPGPAPGAP